MLETPLTTTYRQLERVCLRGDVGLRGDWVCLDFNYNHQPKKHPLKDATRGGETMRIIRAEDGESFDLNTTLFDIEQSGPLKAFLQDVTGIDASLIICFLSDGTQLRNENMRDFTGVEDQALYVFNRDYLELPVEQILQELLVQPDLQPEIDVNDPTASPTSLISAYSRAANFHNQHILHRATQISSQLSCLPVASLNLDTHVLALTSAYEAFATAAQKELDKQEEILTGHALDMEVIARIKVHKEFLSPTVRRAVELGGKERHLGDYVSAPKMAMVADSCAKMHDEHLQRFLAARDAMNDLTAGADEVRRNATNPFMADIDLCVQRAKELSDQVTQAPYDAPVEAVSELDELLREEVRAIADLKNRATEHSLQTLRTVSHLQSTLADLPQTLTTLETDLRVKGGFPHLQRLHNMLYFYGATVVEIVRRKEFAKLFSERAQTIAEMMAKMTANERKRRQVYRSEVHGQLPFEAKGMDEPVPSLEISTNGSTEPGFSLTRDDLVEFLNVVDDLSEADIATSQSGVANPVREVRAALDKLVARIDTLESDFDKLAEKSILSTSWSANSKRRSSSNDVASSAAYRDAVEQLQEKTEQERQLREAYDTLTAENRRLRESVERLEEEGEELRQTVTSEAAARKSLEQRQSNSLKEAVEQARLLEAAVKDANTYKEEVAELRKDKKDKELLLDEVERLKTALQEAQERPVEVSTQVEAKEELERVEQKARDFEEHNIRNAEQIVSLERRNERLEQRLEDAETREMALTRSAMRLRDAATKASTQLQKYILSSNKQQQATQAHSDRDPTASLLIQSPLPASPPPAPASTVVLTPEIALATLTAFDVTAFTETIGKTASTIRRWQKQCKEYRDRSRSKITYKNFAKGDLALFLPTRSSVEAGVARTWAAFNVSFPHYFLKADGTVARQLQNREWVVARISSITERVVDPRDPESNPYRLEDGFKYFVIEVEDWTQQQQQPATPNRAGPSRPRGVGRSASSEPARRPTSVVDDDDEGSMQQAVGGLVKSPSPFVPILEPAPEDQREHLPEAGPSRLETPSPVSSTRSRTRSLRGTPLSVPFSGRRPLTIPGGFTAGSSPDNSSSKASAAVGVTTMDEEDESMLRRRTSSLVTWATTALGRRSSLQGASALLRGVQRGTDPSREPI